MRDCEEALRFDERCPHALGASVFDPEEPARRLAARVRVGAITINDLIAPPADPRLPFDGRGESGLRGDARRRGIARAHLREDHQPAPRPHAAALSPTTAGAGTLFRQDLRAAHGPGWITRLRAGAALLAALVRRAHPCRRAAVGGTTRLQSK